jgi:CDGSH-type Zn-finger protein
MAKASRKTKKSPETAESKITIEKDGPYLVSGGLQLCKEYIVPDREGMPAKWKKGEAYPKSEHYSLCRCGKSGNKPFCDGTHANAGFDGTETAERKDFYSQAKNLSGPTIDMADAEIFCSLARVCHRAGGIWANVLDSNNSKSKKIAIQESWDCPSGRLVVLDKKTGKPIEPKFSKSISVTEEPDPGISGPLWVKGGVKVESSDGKAYGQRNRVTLCRCGKSGNKPFCDASHVGSEFNDGDSLLRRGKK